MFQVALIGTGCIAQNHIAALKTLKGVRLVAIVNHPIEAARKVAEDAGCKASSRFI